MIALAWLSIDGPPSESTPARRIRGSGEDPILAFAFAPDGATIATLQVDGRAALRDAAGVVATHSFLDHRGPASALAFAPDGRTLLVGGTGPDLVAYDLRAGGAGHPLGMPIRAVKALAISPDGRTLAAAGDDADLRLWDVAEILRSSDQP